MSVTKYTDFLRKELDVDYTNPSVFLINYADGGVGPTFHTNSTVRILKTECRFFVRPAVAEDTFTAESYTPESKFRAILLYNSHFGGIDRDEPDPTIFQLLEDPTHICTPVKWTELDFTNVLFDRTFLFDPLINYTNELGERTSAWNVSSQGDSIFNSLQSANVLTFYEGSGIDPMTGGGLFLILMSTLDRDLIVFPYRKHKVDFYTRVYWADGA